MMRIHREGYGILLVLLVVFVSANFLAFTLFQAGRIFALGFLGISATIYLFLLWFFRVPHRVVSPDSNLILAPADGRIVAVEETGVNEYFSDSRLQVSIFMSPLNVHANYYPVGGPVRYFKYHPGNYFVAWHPKASDSNERTSVVVGDTGRLVLVRQIAGAVARRIVCYARTGESVEQGQELGFIKFGSRVDIFLPSDAKVMVKPGDRVKAKHSVVATFK
jgi:phosphatidylserine decarboxylase